MNQIAQYYVGTYYCRFPVLVTTGSGQSQIVVVCSLFANGFRISEFRIDGFQFIQCRSHADITMADFWGISEVDSTFDDDKGTSLILLNTEKGVSFFNNITLRQRSFSYDIALKYNEGLREGSYYHPRRDFFFSNFPNTKSVIALLKESQIPTLSMQISRYKNAIVRRIKKLL